MSFATATDLGNHIFSIIGNFVSFITVGLGNIAEYFISLIHFLLTYLFDLPFFIINIFVELPTFARVGLSVLVGSIIIAFIFRIIKLIIPFI